jgi:hypothetical protein
VEDHKYYKLERPQSHFLEEKENHDFSQTKLNR